MQTLEEKGRKRQKHRLWLDGIKILNVILIMLPFALLWLLYYRHLMRDIYAWKGNVVVILIFIILFVFFGRTYQAFRISVSRISEVFYSQFLAILFTDFLMYVICFLLIRAIPPILPMLLILAIQLIIAAIWARSTHILYYKKTSPAPTLVIWDTREAMEELIDSYGMGKRFEIIQTIHVDDCMANTEKTLGMDGLRVVFLCGIHSHERNQIVKYCVANSIRAYVIPRVGDVIMSGANPMTLFHLPMLKVERYNPSPYFLIVKRLFDIVVCSIALAICSPVMLVVSILIRKDGGPAFYRQVRLTKNGKKFEVLKFRSMRVDAEKDGVARLSTGENDDRITPIGRKIRACRIDGSVIIRQTRKEPVLARVSPVLSNTVLPSSKQYLSLKQIFMAT